MTLRLSATLRTLRKQAGLTQSALAEALGVSDRAVSRWERLRARCRCALQEAIRAGVGEVAPLLAQIEA